ncbi:hypothetical protein L7F22_003510 [Adiantum nelumboides]|nr:hypothetical protein [Adiantum nelumboides]
MEYATSLDDEDDIYSRDARQSRTRHGQSIQLLQIDILRQSLPPGLESEMSRDYVLPDCLQPLVHTYDRKHYGGWEGGSLPRDGEVFSFWGARYMIGYGASLQNIFTIDDTSLSNLKTHDWHNFLKHVLPLVIDGCLTTGIRDVIYRLGKLARQQSRASARDTYLIEEELGYVGTIAGIYELDYRVYKRVVLKVDWFRADYKGARATMRQECSGFWSVDSSKPLRITQEPYILPAHYSDLSRTPSPPHYSRGGGRTTFVLPESAPRMNWRLHLIMRKSKFYVDAPVPSQRHQPMEYATSLDDEDDIYSRDARQSCTRHGQSIQLLQIDILRQSLPPGLESEMSRDYVLPDCLQPLVHTYDRKHYGGWEGGSLPRDGEVFSFWGARYMIGYGASLQNIFTIDDTSLSNLKTHDWHNFLKHVLPLVIDGCLTTGIRDVIYRLGKLARQQSRASARDTYLIEEELGYVGTIAGIYELDYRVYKRVVLKVDWFHADYKGARATMRQECSGFWSVDSSKPLRITQEPYILPAHCEQAFFYAALDSNSPWRQVVPINPRGRRIFDTTYVEADQNSLHEDDPTSTEPLPLTTLAQEEPQEEAVDNNDAADDETEDLAMEIEFEPHLLPQPSIALSPTLPLDIHLTAEELQETIQDNKEIELIIDLFPNYD